MRRCFQSFRRNFKFISFIAFFLLGIGFVANSIFAAGTPPSNSHDSIDPTTGRVCTSDEYTQPSAPAFTKADIIFIPDTSCSMKTDWQRAALNIKHLMAQLPSGVDVHVGVILAHVGQKSGKLYAARNEPLVLSNSNLTYEQMGQSLYSTFQSAAQETDPALGQAAFFSLNTAVTRNLAENQRRGIFRPDATLSVVFISDKSEIGFPFPNPQAAGLPPRCDAYWVNHFKTQYYDANQVTLDSVLAKVRALKKDVPLRTHAIVNTNAQDLFIDNDPHAACLSESLGYGYFDFIQKTNGVLFSIKDDNIQGMIHIGQSIHESMDLFHDFQLSKTPSQIDPAFTKSSVDGIDTPFIYDATSNSVHIVNAGTYDSRIQIQHCDFYHFSWTITDPTGIPAVNSIALQWGTLGEDTKATVRVGLAADTLSFRSIDVTEFSATHMITVDSLQPDTTYYFEVTAHDKFSGTATSHIVPIKTLAAPPPWSITDFNATTTTNSAQVNWKTGTIATNAILHVGLSATDLSFKTINLPTANTSQSQLVDGLASDTEYFFQVEATDANGLKQVSNIISQRTQALTWRIENFAGIPAFISVKLAWTTTLPTTAVLRVGTSATDLTLQTISAPTSASAQTVEVNGLLANTTYFFQVTATDAQNNSQSSAVISVQTQQQSWNVVGLDGTTTQTSATLIWQTPNTMTNAKVLVGLSATDLTLMAVDVPQFASSQTVTVTGLQPSTRYFFVVEAVDQAGRKVISNIISKVTKPVN